MEAHLIATAITIVGGLLLTVGALIITYGLDGIVVTVGREVAMRKITSSMPTSDGDPEDMEGIGTGGAAKAIKGDVQLSTQDLESIEQAARDYIEGWFEADSERLRSCLHPDLAKRTVDFDREQRSWVLRQVDFTRFINSTAGTQIPPDSRGYEITTLDTHRNIAIVKVVSMPFVDYLQVARFDRRWQIVNVLWERREE